VDRDFREWAAARLPALLRYAHVLTGNPHRAEDIVQTALAHTLAAWPRVRRKDNPENYVRRAILRLVINSGRLSRREHITGRPPEMTAPDRIAGADERMVMWAALATLPPRQRSVVVLRYYEDLTEAQIAEILGCSRGTVKSQASKALAKLRAHFQDAEVRS
jgi:RNA polymerase sigma-70 factor (sigma-E family)